MPQYETQGRGYDWDNDDDGLLDELRAEVALITCACCGDEAEPGRIDRDHKPLCALCWHCACGYYAEVGQACECGRIQLRRNQQ